MRLALAVPCVVLAAAACTAEPGPEPEPSVVPRPPAPLDVSRLLTAPCSVPPPGQPVAKDVAGATAAGATCTWRPARPHYPEYAVTAESPSAGLAGLYRRREQLPGFEEKRVSGYPAVVTGTEGSTAHHARCTLAVGVAEDALVTVVATVPTPSGAATTPCADASQFAHAVVAGLKGGG